MNTIELMNSTLVQSIKGKKEKAIIPVLCVWSFIHTYILLKYLRIEEIIVYIGGTGESSVRRLNPLEMFYPFTFFKTYNYNQNTKLMEDISNIKEASELGMSRYFDIRFYDYTEYFVYVGGVWMIYFLYKYLKGNKLIEEI